MCNKHTRYLCNKHKPFYKKIVNHFCCWFSAAILIMLVLTIPPSCLKAISGINLYFPLVFKVRNWQINLTVLCWSVLLNTNYIFYHYQGLQNNDLHFSGGMGSRGLEQLLGSRPILSQLPHMTHPALRGNSDTLYQLHFSHEIDKARFKSLSPYQ